MYIVDDKGDKRGNFIVNFNIKIPKGNKVDKKDKEKIIKIFEGV